MHAIEPASNWSTVQGSPAVEIDPADLALTMVANFRAHPHVCNVMTHISGGNWTKVEKALAAILDLERTDAKLSKLAENIVELICAERGVTGRILKPFFAQLLGAYLSDEAARAVSAHVELLFLRMSEPDVVPAPAQAEQELAATAQWILIARTKDAKSLAFCA